MVQVKRLVGGKNCMIQYNQKTNNKYNEIWFGVDGLKDTALNYRVGINWQQSFDAMCLGVKKGKQVNWQWIHLVLTNTQ